MRSAAYNRFGVLMGTSSRASSPRWLSLRGNSLPMITLISSQGDFCATATNLAELLVRKIVRSYAFRLSVRLVVPPPIGKRAHEFLLFRIHRNDRLPRTLKHFHTAVDIAKLGIPIGMRRPL